MGWIIGWQLPALGAGHDRRRQRERAASSV